MSLPGWCPLAAAWSYGLFPLLQAPPLQPLLLISCVSVGRHLSSSPLLCCVLKNFGVISEQMSYRWHYGAHV